MLKRVVLILAIALLLVPTALLAQAQAPPAAAKPAPAAAAPVRWADEILKQESYTTPPAELVPAVMAPRHLNVALGNLSPDKKWFLNEIGDGPVGMATFSKPFHELGGLFVDFKANRARPLTIRNNAGIQLISAADATRKVIALPAGARVSNAASSPDGTLIAFVHTEDATHIWVASVATGATRQLTTRPVLATLVSTFEFSNDSKKIAVVLVPDNRPAMPGCAGGPVWPVGETRRRHR